MIIDSVAATLGAGLHFSTLPVRTISRIVASHAAV